MALGATSARLLRMVIGQGLTQVAAGLALGVAGSLAVIHMLGGLLYGVEPTDPLTYAGVSIVLAGTAWLDCYLPARRAASIRWSPCARNESLDAGIGGSLRTTALQPQNAFQ